MSDMLKIPSVESLDLKIPSDIVEDLIARDIYDNVLQGKQSNNVYTLIKASQIDQTVIDKLKMKGYQVEVLQDKTLKIAW